jgi:hypothetical protein
MRMRTPILILILSGWLVLPTIAATPESETSSIKAAVTEFQNNHSNASWASLAQTFKSYLSNIPSPSNDELKTTGLTDLGVVCIQQPSLKLWYFPKVAEDHGVYLQWPEGHVQYLPLPNGIALKDARLLVLSRHNDSPHLATVVTKKKSGKHKPTAHRVAAPAAANKFLVLAGLQQQGNILWLDCYQLSGGMWRQNNAPLSKIPPFLLGNLAGDISFVGSDLILTASPSGEQPPTPTTTGEPTKGKKPDLSVYKLSLKLVDNYYLLDGQGHADTAYGAITQFLQAEQRSRIDLAKSWLEDPAAASIPKYLKLFSQGTAPNFRLISLAGPQSISRYRLITFGRDDLIFDVAHPKDQWIIKAIFVAPSDLGWQKMTQSLPPVI